MSQEWSYSNLILVIIIPAIVSYVTGDTWVNHSTKKRKHSEKLRDSIGKFLENCNIYYHDQVRINNVGQFKEVHNTKIETLDYSVFLFEHIKSAYPKLEKKWKDHETLWKQYITKKTQCLEQIRKHFHDLGNELKITPLFKYEGINKPESFVYPENIAYSIFKEFEEQANGRDPLYFEPTRNYTENYNAYYFNDKNIFNIKDRSVAENVDKEILDFIQNKENYDLYNEFREARHKMDEKRKEVLVHLKQVSEKIDLGHNIKGLCSTCLVLGPMIFHKQYWNLRHRIYH